MKKHSDVMRNAWTFFLHAAHNFVFFFGLIELLYALRLLVPSLFLISSFTEYDVLDGLFFAFFLMAFQMFLARADRWTLKRRLYVLALPAAVWCFAFVFRYNLLSSLYQYLWALGWVRNISDTAIFVIWHALWIGCALPFFAFYLWLEFRFCKKQEQYTDALDRYKAEQKTSQNP